MRSIEILRRALPTEHFSLAEVMAVLGEIREPLSLVSRMAKAGEIVRLRNGLFVFGPEYQKRELNLFSVANLLFGPSYVSLESALSYYGMIPEGVQTVTSITWKRTKHFTTPLANFDFRRIPKSAFPVGVRWQDAGSARFLIASREKAVLDKLYLDAPIPDLFEFLHQSLRIEQDSLRRIRAAQLTALVPMYDNSTFASRIATLVARLKDEYD